MKLFFYKPPYLIGIINIKPKNPCPCNSKISYISIPGHMGTSNELNWAVGWLSDNRKSEGGSLPTWTFALSDKNTINYFM